MLFMLQKLRVVTLMESLIPLAVGFAMSIQYVVMGFLCNKI